jgi:hypothetical protein
VALACPRRQLRQRRGAGCRHQEAPRAGQHRVGPVMLDRAAVDVDQALRRRPVVHADRRPAGRTGSDGQLDPAAITERGRRIPNGLDRRVRQSADTDQGIDDQAALPRSLLVFGKRHPGAATAAILMGAARGPALGRRSQDRRHPSLDEAGPAPLDLDPGDVAGQTAGDEPNHPVMPGDSPPPGRKPLDLDVGRGLSRLRVAPGHPNILGSGSRAIRDMAVFI